jgi:trehalose-6-phosphate synthase
VTQRDGVAIAPVVASMSNQTLSLTLSITEVLAMPTAAYSLPLLKPFSREDFDQLQLNLPSLKIVSYRGPGESGGVANSLGPVVKQLGTKINWFALSGVPSTDNHSGQFQFHAPQASQSVLENHRRVASGYLWPLLHGMPERAQFDLEDWKSFRQLNEVLASECLDVSSQSFPTLFWLHDFEVALVAPLCAMHAGVILTHFWHVPWPAAEIMTQSPIARKLVDALLCNKVLGFHTTEYATNFLTTVQELFPNTTVDMLRMEVKHRGHHTRVVVMPLGIDFELWHRRAKSTRPVAEALAIKHGLSNQIVLGIDRLDYSKGVLEKLQGLEKFLADSTYWHKRFSFVQISQRPQSNDEHYSDYAKAVKAKVDSINEQFGREGWQPIAHIEKQLDQSELAAWYQAADVLAVSPVRDGLNLIAKEFVACRLDEQGVLILSKQAGCAAELSQGSVEVNPHSDEEFAKALAQALVMEPEEKRRRMTAMRRVVGWNRLHDWALGFLKEALTK